jgi:hypothetical protein
VTGAKTFSGFTVLGAGPAIKIKKITGTTASTQGGTVEVAHGLTSAKILSLTGCVFHTETDATSPGSAFSGYYWAVSFTSTNITIANKSSESANILSKPFHILITYEE